MWLLCLPPTIALTLSPFNVNYRDREINPCGTSSLPIGISVLGWWGAVVVLFDPFSVLLQTFPLLSCGNGWWVLVLPQGR